MFRLGQRTHDDDGQIGCGECQDHATEQVVSRFMEPLGPARFGFGAAGPLDRLALRKHLGVQVIKSLSFVFVAHVGL